MTHINLLPWREQARLAQKKQFLISIAGAIGIVLIVILIWHLYIRHLISKQQVLNNYYKQELAVESQKLTLLKKNEKQQMELQEKLQFLFSLRDSGYKVIQLLNELTKIVPDTIILLQIKREGDKTTIMGEADSKLSITLMMENLAKTKIFKNPNIKDITEGVEAGEEKRYFKLIFEQD